MALTNNGAQRFLNSLLGGASPNSPSFGALSSNPTHLGLALNTGTPLQDGTGFNEPSTGDNYSRLALSLGAGGDFTTATDADPSLIENGAGLTFPAAQNTNWGTITHLGFFNGGTVGGNDLILLLTLTTPRVINIGQALTFGASGIQITAT